MATGTIKNMVGWTLAGTSTESSQTVSFPATATELYLVATQDKTGTKASYSNIIPISLIPTETNRLMIGGYGATASDYGYAIVSYNENNRTVALYQFHYYTYSNGILNVYYR